MECDVCNGLGYEVKTNIMKATKEKVPCQKCGGSGQSVGENTGLRASIVKCQVVLYQWLICGKVVSTLELWVFPFIVDGNQVILDIEDKKVPLRFAQISKMNTKKMYRRRGYMKKCLQALMGDMTIVRVESSLSDSTGLGESFLKSMGFKVLGDKLYIERRRYGDKRAEVKQASDN